ncbi:hypothetical protein [Rickettsiella endosymbiont of Miltochrista miniata]|uniref:hypothetical protein n=1 Tax=Rickettsiella endosymbiont of Miltochrista miniata TaxID=3066239 RepID=UPI00313BC0E4
MPDNIFYYVVGSPIAFTIPEQERSFSQTSLYQVYRNDIKLTEIIEAFPPKNKKIEIFFTEEDALEVSRSLREGENYDVMKQPAIYKVKIKQALEDSPAQKSLAINGEGLLFRNHSYDQKQRTSNVECYEIYNDDTIEMIEVHFKVHKLDEGEYHTAYPSFLYKDRDKVHLAEEQKSASQKQYKSMIKAGLFAAVGVTVAGACYVYNHVDISVSFKN